MGGDSEFRRMYERCEAPEPWSGLVSGGAVEKTTAKRVRIFESTMPGAVEEIGPDRIRDGECIAVFEWVPPLLRRQTASGW
jgi:hypothetical protein